MGIAVASRLLQIQTELVLYALPVILVFGTITNVINMGIFLRRGLRQNICSWYFICLSLVHLLLLLVLCMQAIIIGWTGYNLSATSLAFCKFRQYLFDLVTCLARHFLCLIAIDRWMVTSSNAWLRRQSSPRIARWLIISSILFWSLFNMHSAIEYIITGGLCIAPLTSIYFLFYSIYNIIISVTPMIVMIVFSILTLRNLRSSRIEIAPSTHSAAPNQTSTIAQTNPSAPRRRSQRDIHLIRLSIIQVAAFLIFNSGWCVYPLYLFITSARGNRTLEERLISAFMVGFGFNLLYTYAALTFVLYTLASAHFRKECRMALQQLLRILKQRFQIN